MYYYMSVSNIPFVTSSGVLPLFNMELLVILCIFLPILRFKSFVKNWSVMTTVPLGTFIIFVYIGNPLVRPPLLHQKCGLSRGMASLRKKALLV